MKTLCFFYGLAIWLAAFVETIGTSLDFGGAHLLDISPFEPDLLLPILYAAEFYLIGFLIQLFS